jgi:hypothetical protein
MELCVAYQPPSMGHGFFLRTAPLAALLLVAACAGAPAAVAPHGTVEQAQEDFRADVSYCQRVRSSRVGTLGPTVFQPISGDEVFNECVTRAKNHLDIAMLEE